MNVANTTISHYKVDMQHSKYSLSKNNFEHSLHLSIESFLTINFFLGQSNI